jgi:ABC-type phosphate transport system substrate-binding protein
MSKLILPTVFLLVLTARQAHLPAVRAATDEVDVVVGRTNGVNALSREEIRKIFTGEKGSWPSGKRITVLMLTSDHPERAIVLREIFRMNESDYTRYFLQAAFTGRVPAAPKEFSSGAEMKARLAANPNAIGYLKKEDVDDTVKVLLKLP